MPVPTLTPCSFEQATASGADSIVYVTANYKNDDYGAVTKLVTDTVTLDNAFLASPNLLVSDQIPGKRLIVSNVGSLDKDYDDVRKISDAVEKGIKRAKAAGSTKPFLLLSSTLSGPVASTSSSLFTRALDVALLASLSALYVPLTVRQLKGEHTVETIRDILFQWGSSSSNPSSLSVDQLKASAKLAVSIEVGRRLAKEIGGGDPEAMAPVAAANHVVENLTNAPGVKITVISDTDLIAKEYPCVHAVARASLVVPRHHPRIVRLEYTPEDTVTQSVYLIGKGVTYDTGGVDVKHSGHMAGMSRDKCGAAAAAGFIATLSSLRAKGIHVVAYLGFVRNSIGSDSYVSDEIITTHAGKRILVVNTDAEGRMVLLDLLSHARAEVIAIPKDQRPPVVFHTIATLTGHAIIAVGFGYTIAVENGPARNLGIANRLAREGALIGDPVDVSILRQDDFNFVAPKTSEYDVQQCNTAPSSATPRGSIFPAAVMIIASGLDAHGQTSTDPIPYCHLDIAGSSVTPPFLNGVTTGCPIAALTATYVNSSSSSK